MIGITLMDLTGTLRSASHWDNVRTGECLQLSARQEVMNQTKIDRLGDTLYAAMCDRRMLPPLTDTHFALKIESANEISLRLLANCLTAGETLASRFSNGVPTAPVIGRLMFPAPVGP